MDKEGKTQNLNLDQFPKSKWKLNKVTLGDVLKYENPLIVNRLLRDHPSYTREQAEQFFYEMKKWFFVKARAEMEKPDDVVPYMYDEIDQVDYAWHAFLLFTVHYQEFGQQYFSKMLQHTPSLVQDPELQRGRFYEYVRETLGEDTYISWFIEQNFNPHKSK